MPPMLQATAALARPKQRDPLAMFLFVSLVLHLLLLLLFPAFQRTSFDEVPKEQLTEVDLLPESAPAPPPAALAKVVPPPAPPVAEEKPQPREEEKPPPPEPRAREQLPEQIVSPPDRVNDQEPEKARLLSDRNSTAKEETVAHGFPRAADKEPPPVKEVQEQPKEPVEVAKKSSEAQSPAKPAQERLPTKKESAQPKPPRGESVRERSPEKKEIERPKPPVQLAMKPPEASPVPKAKMEKELDRLPESRTGETAQPQSQAPGAPDAAKRAPRLFVGSDELLSQDWFREAEQNRVKEKTRQSPSGSEIVAMAPSPAPNLFSMPGPIGTPDDLPDIRQGNLTFLNTKAHRFAPFVRRVALRVFQHLIILQRKNLHINDVVAAREMSTIEAKLDANGTLKGLVIQTRSGSYAVDSALLKACENGAWDENPPQEAHAEDGMIHFIFRSDINAQYDDLGLRAILTTLQVGLV
jgi:hypothetical protein